MKKRGIAKAVEQEILASYEQLYRLAITYVKNEQDAMDVVQESAYKAMKNAGQVKEETYIKTWLWRIVINTSLDMCKKQKSKWSIYPGRSKRRCIQRLGYAGSVGRIRRTGKNYCDIKIF